MSKRQLASSLISVVLVCAGCGDATSISGDTYASKMRECGLVEGDGRVPNLFGDYASTDCWGECVSELACAEIEEMLCQVWVDRTDPERCMQDCFPGVLCGDGTEVPYYEVCDAIEQCDDGSDEEGCEYFECGEGDPVSADSRCDGEKDCADNSDEKDCEAELVACGNEQFVPTHWLCDGTDDCGNGFDEQGCATSTLMCPDAFACETGGFIPEEWQCDGEPDCPGGSDERDCAPEGFASGS